MDLHSAPLRRNGRPQACEPCRKRKVACDHRLPHCSRCKRGDIASRCIYIPQSATAATKKASAPLTPGLSPGGIASRGSPYHHHGQSAAFRAPNSGTNTHKHRPTGRIASHYGRQDVELARGGLNTPSSSELASTHIPLEHTLKVRAIDVLSSIPTQDDLNTLEYTDDNLIDGGCHFTGRFLKQLIWSGIGDTLLALHTTADIEKMVLYITKNTSSRLKDDIIDPQEWCESFSGAKIRWESVGIMFTYWALQTAGLPRQLPQNDGNGLVGELHRKDLLAKFTDKAIKCAHLTQATCPGKGSHLLLYLLYKLEILASMVYGDSCITSPFPPQT